MNPAAQLSRQNPAMRALALARINSDYVVLAVTFLLFFIGTSLYFLINGITGISQTSENASFGEYFIGVISSLTFGTILFCVILALGMFMVRMQRQSMLGNSLHVRYSDFSWLREWSNKVAADLAMPEVEIYITQNPYMNAYAMGFVRPYIIVLNSATIRYLTEEELKTIVIHEMGHIKLWHTNASVYLAPFLAIPIISIFAAWISGFWTRRAELACDRLALGYTGDNEMVKSALIKVHVGPDAAKYLNQTAESWLQYTAERPMNRLAQTFSTHPFLVRRLAQLNRLDAQVIAPFHANTEYAQK